MFVCFCVCLFVYLNCIPLFISVRYNINCVKTLNALSDMIKSLYNKEQVEAQQTNPLLSLSTVYELILSHSNFLPIMLGNEHADVKGKGIHKLYTCGL